MQIYLLFLTLVTVNSVLFTTQNKKITIYSTVEDKKWALKRLFFIAKKEKDSKLYNFPKNMINHIFEFVVPEPRCYIKSLRKVDMPIVTNSFIEDIFFAHHFYYYIRHFSYLKNHSLNNMHCYKICSDVLVDNSVFKMITTALQRTIDQDNFYLGSVDTIFVCNMTPEEFQKQLDKANEETGPRCQLKEDKGQRVFSCNYK